MNNYNDFQLPDNACFKLLNKAYYSSKNTTSTQPQYLFTLINNAINSCFSINNKLNSKIKSSIFNTKKELDKLKENLTLLYPKNNQNYIQQNPYQIKEFNIFDFLKEINNIIVELVKTNNSYTEKEQIIILKSILSLINSTQYILSSLSTSKVSLYRYL